ncbi:transposase [Nonomuraea endophytica]|uniref:Transposase n=1 Tax=Nonomuraea endophytica TaxID=714136 RepID=A0A7W8EM07_9ACTN|nr:transposase [Nonomuraea endophytica]MBB5083948.1 transposase [Nonomuraea endophytica]
MEALARRLVPDAMWEAARPLMPGPRPRRQGGGRAAADARTVMAAVVYVITSGCAWQHLPPVFGVTVPTAHRWYTRWTSADLWQGLCEATADNPGLADWTRTIRDCAASRVYD